MSISKSLHSIEQQIAKACTQAGRSRAGVTLIAVTKQQTEAALEEALSAGLRHFGENRVQEAGMHWQDRRKKYSDLRLHLIGPLQTNKVREAVALFDEIHTLDRPKLVDALAHEMKKQNRFLPCFLQVNTGNEPQKAGAHPQDIASLLAYARGQGLTVKGLMSIPPVEEPAGLHFAFLKTLADRLGLSELSMGMSADFENALLAGATHIRLGSVLFGERNA